MSSNNPKETDEIGTTERSRNSTKGNDSSAETTTSSTKGFARVWSETIDSFRVPIVKAMQSISRIAATNPKTTTRGITVFAFGIFVVGLLTNFNVDVDEDVLWTPRNAKPVKHADWIDDVSGFEKEPRYFLMFFHNNGDNVLGKGQVSRVFQALDAVRDLPDYGHVCAESESGDCNIHGVVSFWNDSSAIFEESTSSDEEVIVAMSASNYPDGTPVAENDVMGFPTRDADNLLTFVQSYTIRIDLPDTETAEEFESDALDIILDMSKKWDNEDKDGIRLLLEVQAERSFSDEFERAIVNDIPLVPIVFIIMSIFTCFIFSKNDKVKSRAMLGFGAVISVFLSIMTGYGLMFVTGVPFTSMTQILPFIIFGIGLDDAFIISGAYNRTDASKDPAARIHDTFQEIGLSIALTKLTSTLAFGLGCLSTIPAVFWLCLYAFPTIIFVLLYQTTFFVACVVLDERRIEQSRRDCCSCFTVDQNKDSDTKRNGDQEVVEQDAKDQLEERIMHWYAQKLLMPWTKAAVLIAFSGLLAVCVHSTSQLRQQFEFTDVVPSDSYVTDFFNAFEAYTARSEVAPSVYFRYVDQSDSEIQQQMEDYINELVKIEAIVDTPEFFWLWDFRIFVNQTKKVADLPFKDQISAFLEEPVYFELYGDDIVLGPDGAITASRCTINMDNLDLEDVNAQVDALADQREVTKAQPINKGKDEWPFFTHDGIYNIWEFFSASVDELIFTTIIGVVAVTGVALVFIPHWTAALFILPLICILYIDVLGVMQWAGVTINAVSYISLVMSIGLLVDYIMHVLVRYYESNKSTRTEKTVDLLRTMGASVLTGAVSTFLGTLPLAFSTSEIFRTVFYAFLGLVTVGASHGLIVLPVVLSMVGPVDTVGTSQPVSSLDKDPSKKSSEGSEE